MKNRLKHNQKFCETNESLDFTNTDFVRSTRSVLIGKCVKIYKSYTTKYVFNIKEYELNTYQVLFTRNKSFERPWLNKHYKNNNIQETSDSLLAKIKLMER